MSAAFEIWKIFVPATNTPITTQQQLADRLAQRTQLLTVEAVQALCARIPAYRALPDEAVRGEVTAIIRRNLELIWLSLRTGRESDADALADLTASAARRADEHIPLSDILLAYHIGAEHLWVAISTHVEDIDLLAYAAGTLQAHLRAATAAVLAGYGAEQAPTYDDLVAKQALLTALISGTDPNSTAAQVGLPIASSYWVVVMSIARHPDENLPEVDQDVVRCRKARRLQRELNRLALGRALCDVMADGGISLIPSSPDIPVDRVREQLLAIERAVGAPLLAALAPSTPTDVPTTLAQARELLAVARNHGRQCGVVTLEDIAVEFQLSRPSAAHTVLVEILRPLFDHERTMETFAAYLDCGCDRSVAAQQLNVHTNTVGYRLRKATMLTGLDLTNPRDIVRATAALAAYRAVTGQSEVPHPFASRL
ncbi:PucR family transcriptional regulator [Mycolicibacterium mageritense]|uniref:PucR family transcriptional regulator n=1 Tax=Mycolicibacterium mageritense TaxID=53462 RepID=UPI00103CC08B|nr:helix-turn-helix domain-containing protein [Mycolicibacterium mageritense]TXI65835.1 MAG: PucR family transcriptional regulator [Mycolicibacterium mageritense]